MKIGRKGSGGAFAPDQGLSVHVVCVSAPISLVLALYRDRVSSPDRARIKGEINRRSKRYECG